MAINNEALAQRLGDKLRDLGATVTTAESCTGGGVAFSMTAIPGSSRWFDRGFVTYTNPEDDLETQITTVGAIDPAWELKLSDKNRNEVTPGEVGEVAIRGDTVMTEYWNKPETTRKTIDKEGWLYTGDLATMDERGYITLVGRSKEMYISGGENVYPREIEDVIEKHPAVMLVCVLPKKDPVFQEVGKAYVVVKEGESLSETE